MTQEGEGEGLLLTINLQEKKMLIAGLDEVGKGALFGPVVASAVILDFKSGQKLISLGLKDSKRLSKKKRINLVPFIKELSLCWGIGQCSAQEIDNLGIRTATEKAMILAIEDLLPFIPELILVDGSLPIRIWKGEQKCLIRGESKSASIAAASVLAKEYRDELIRSLAIKFPGYSLHTNVGYGTTVHRKSILDIGPTELHRKSFLSKLMQK